MNSSSIDPEYYRSDYDDDGHYEIQGGHWLISERFDRERRIWAETKMAVDAGEAQWLPRGWNEHDIPF